MLLWIVLSTSWSSAQSSYRLLPDSTVRDVHYRDLKRWASFRLASDEMRRSLAREVAQYGRIVHEQDEQITALIRVVEARKGEVDKLEADNYQLEITAKMWEQKAQKAKGWATVGKVGTIAVACVVGAFIYKEVRP